MIVKEVSYEMSRTDRRFADRQPAGSRRRHVPHRRDAEIRGAGDPQEPTTSAGRRRAIMTDVSQSIAVDA